MEKATQVITYWRHAVTTWKEEPGAAIVEMPVSLSVNGEVWLSFMCTPVNLEAMGVGFLFNEGVIESKEEIADVRVCDSGDNVDVWLHHSVEKPARWWRTSGCTGGVTSIENEPGKDEPDPNTVADEAGSPSLPLQSVYIGEPILTPLQISELVDDILEVQSLYRISGGVHTSALSDGLRLLLVAEDIGRHNTLDKIAGRCLLEDIHLSQPILITTGRISSEMLQKSTRIGAVVVISRTAPSSLAIKMADQAGITLIGYARRSQFNVYTHPSRLEFI